MRERHVPSRRRPIRDISIMTPYTDGRGNDGENTKAEARWLRAQPRAARVQHTRAQAET